MEKQRQPINMTRELSSGSGHSPGSDACASPPNGPNSGYFPNVVVMTHENRRALFYDDLLRGKTVLINCMSVKDEAQRGHTGNLRKVQQHIGSRLGRDVYMYSITIDPENDTPAKLARFAETHGAGPGWLFLTGAPVAIRRIKDSLFSHGPGHAHDHADAEDCSMAMIRYGNEAVGLWGTVPIASRPEWIAQRVSWVESRPAPTGPFRRRGPFPRPTSAG
jgi:protein SCO1/2